MQRREFLQRHGRTAAALALAGLFTAPHWNLGLRRAVPLPPGDDPFTLGVASGMPRSDSVVLWTRLAPRPHEPLGGAPDAPLELRWQLADDERFSRGVREGRILTLPEHAHSAHVEVNALPSDRRFFYRFIAGDAVSPTGRTRTAPAIDADVQRLRLALASCQHYEQGAFAAHREIAAQDLDLVLFVGDYIYESSNPRFRIRSHEGPVPTTLDGYRARHATYKLDADLRAAHAAHPWVVTWDDHEVVNDYAGERAPLDHLDPPGAFLERRAAAYKAYFEHMPVSPSMAPRGGGMALHAHYGWGSLAELWTLDSRQYRSIQPCPDDRGLGGRIIPSCDEIDDPQRTMLGANQERWLARGLAESRSQWRLLGIGSQLSEGRVSTRFGGRVHTDGWDGYPQARQRLLNAVADAGKTAGAAAGNVIALGGDVHRHVAAQLRLRSGDRRSPLIASEFVASSISTRGISEAAMALVRSSNPDLLHARSDERGYALVEVTPRAAHCDFRATAFPVRPEARMRSQAQVTVEAGQAGPQLG